MPFLHNYEATPAGEQLLQDNPADLITVVDAFYDAEGQAGETALFNAVYEQGGHYVAAGRFSHVMRLGDYAIKVSTPTSTASEERPDVEPFAEDATRQMHFLHRLRGHLDRQPDAITTPEQYFSVHAAYGGRLVVQQFMDGWTSLGDWADRALRFKDDDTYDTAIKALSTTVKARVEAAVVGSDLLDGLNDLRLEQEYDIIHPHNFLVPKGSTFDPDTVPLCIIDQPKTYILPSGEALKKKRK